MKKAVACFLCVVICIGVFPVSALAAARDTSFEETLAADLKQLGLFLGVSDTDFDLDREPSRAEAVVMLIRLYGKESEALGKYWSHPFTDVPSWADRYVGYAYQQGWTNGISANKFGMGMAEGYMYLTFVLRALGYSDVNGADFTWNNPYGLARSTGILPDCVNLSSFWRADVVLVSYSALPAKLKNSTQTLAQKLIAAGAFSQALFDACYDPDAIADYMSGTGKQELSAEAIYMKCSPAVFYIEVYNAGGSAIASGSGFFIDSYGTAVTNFHVIEGASSAKITVSDTGRTYTVAGVYDYSREEDWAVLKINGSGFSYLELGDASTVMGGATVYAIGSPLGLQNTISQGLISNPGRHEDGVEYIQTSAAISHGSSGGALINKYGEVIGITSATYVDGQNLNLALPIRYIEGAAHGGVTPLAQLRISNPVAYLKDYLVRYGDYSASNDAYYLSVSTTDGVASYMVYYCLEDGELSLNMLYDSDYYCTIYLQGYKTTASNTYSFLFYDDYQGVGGDGYIYAPSFNSGTYVSFTQYTGYSYDRSDYQELAKLMMVDTLFATQYMFDSYGLAITIADLGFTAAYYEYLS